MQKQLLVLCSVLAVGLAALSKGTPDPKPEKFKHLVGCYMKDLDAVIPEGESRPSTKSCMEYRCGKDYVTYVRCGKVRADPPLKVVEDLSLPYPACCPKIVRITPTESEAEKTNKV